MLLPYSPLPRQVWGFLDDHSHKRMNLTSALIGCGMYFLSSCKDTSVTLSLLSTGVGSLNCLLKKKKLADRLGNPLISTKEAFILERQLLSVLG